VPLCRTGQTVTVADVIRVEARRMLRLVARRHVDNMRVASAACRPGR
jgi:hypothetical protein